MRRVLLFILILSAACSHSSSKKNEPKAEAKREGLTDISLNLNVKKYTLENGLRVLISENHKLPIFSYYTFFDVGGRYEEKGTTGATHFLEHMMFKGSEKFGPGIFDTFIESNGGSTNAYTNFDSTVYYENIPSAGLEKLIAMEADRMRGPLLIPEAFESERKVIFEERKYRYENSPGGKLYLGMMQAVFKGTPYGGSVIGEEEDLKSLTRDQVYDFFKKFYAPNNAILVIVGDVDAEDTIGMIREHFGEIKKAEEMEEYKDKRDAPHHYKFRSDFKGDVALYGSTPTPMFMLSYKGEKLGTRKAFVMDILSSILGTGESSYLNQLYVRGKNPLLNNISVGNYNLMHSGVFFISGELLPRVSLKRFEQRLLKDSRRFCKEAVNVRNVQKTKNQFLVGYYGEIQSNAGLASFLGLREFFYGDYEFYKKEIEIYDSIDEIEVQKVCEEIFDGNNHIFVSVWNRHPQQKN